MFKFLKEKLKSAVSKISGKIEEEGKKEEIDAPVEQPKPAPIPVTETKAEEQKPSQEEKIGFFSSIKNIFTKKEEPAAELPISEPVAESAIKEPIDTTKIEHFAPQVVEDVKKEFILPKEEPKPEPPKPVHVAKPVVKQAEPTPLQEKIPQPFPKQPEPPQEKPQEEEKKGFFSVLKEKILTTTINEQQFEDMFFDLELALLENNVAVEVIDKIKHDLKSSLVNHPIRRNKVEETVIISLKDSIKGLFENPFDLIERIRRKQEKPFIIAFVGINGSGKTTSIAKMASMLKEKGFSVVLAAGDTFRAASIEQLSQHGDRLGIKVIKHDYGADPAAVAFDAIKHAQAKSVDVVLIDTAGRMHSNENLIQEMQKTMRVAKPDVKLFVGESITGNDCVEQAKSFNDAIGLDGIILSKADIDEKGGAAVSVSYITKKPILYIGTGQEYKDLKAFNANEVMQNLGLEG